MKAMGIDLAERKVAQVSMNLTDYKVTPPIAAFEAVRAEAERLGVGIEESEIIGLVPSDALTEADCARMRLAGFDRGERVIENILSHAGMERFK